LASGGHTPEELARYSRHLLLPEVGIDGQRRLGEAKVVIVGAGGLGAPVGLYLAAAGVGRLGLVDFDVVDTTNLQRQVLFGTRDVGRQKTEAARARLEDLNPHVDVVAHAVKLTSGNAFDILAPYDIVVDTTDNFPTRYLVNDACVWLGKPCVHGSIFRFDGQVTVFGLDDGPCYRCLYPEPPPAGVVPSCAEGGVLGVLPGIMGSLQANEAIKLIIGKGEPLKGRLLLFDALQTSFREIKLSRNRECPVCGDHPTIDGLIDYDAFCGLDRAPVAGDVPEMSVTELKQRIDAGKSPRILDVREPNEHAFCNLGGDVIPIRELPGRIGELRVNDDLVVYCRTGVRSAASVRFLREQGFRRVWNLRGGIVAWAQEVDPTLPTY
jgi:adenylyltransferase/sulfurtransferase